MKSCISCCCCSITKSCLTLCNPRSAVHQASLSFTTSQCLLTLLCTESVMPPNHLILCHSLLLLLSIFSQPRGLFQWVGSLHQVTKLLALQLQSFQWIFRVTLYMKVVHGMPIYKRDNLRACPGITVEEDAHTANTRFSPHPSSATNTAQSMNCWSRSPLSLSHNLERTLDRWSHHSPGLSFLSLLMTSLISRRKNCLNDNSYFFYKMWRSKVYILIFEIYVYITKICSGSS